MSDDETWTDIRDLSKQSVRRTRRRLCQRDDRTARAAERLIGNYQRMIAGYIERQAPRECTYEHGFTASIAD